MPLVVEFCTFVQDIVSFLDCHRVWNNSLEINIIPNNFYNKISGRDGCFRSFLRRHRECEDNDEEEEFEDESV